MSACMKIELEVEIPAQKLDQLLRRAIAGKRLTRYNYNDKLRIIEPHDYGVHRGSIKLFGYPS